MKYRNLTLTTIALVASSSINAATYTSVAGSSPYSAELQTGAYNWASNSLTTPLEPVSSTDSTYSGSSYYTSSPALRIDEIAPQIGVTGAVDIYYDTTTTTYDYTTQSQQLSINYNDSIDGPLSTPYTIELSGQITADETLLYANDQLGFGLGFNVLFEDPYATNSVNGSLSFLIGNSASNWTYSFQTSFDSVIDNMYFSDNQYLDFSAPIYFQAIYDIAGTNGVNFQLTGLDLDVYASQSTTSSYNHVSTVSSELISHTEIAALPAPVPVPAAAWLFGSGLIGLIGMARRKKAN